jgi:hypothetical protein
MSACWHSGQWSTAAKNQLSPQQQLQLLLE